MSVLAYGAEGLCMDQWAMEAVEIGREQDLTNEEIVEFAKAYAIERVMYLIGDWGNAEEGP